MSGRDKFIPKYAKYPPYKGRLVSCEGAADRAGPGVSSTGSRTTDVKTRRVILMASLLNG